MPLLNKVPAVIARPSARNQTTGKLNVRYKDAKGRTYNAVVLGPGTSSGLKLFIPTRQGPQRIIDNVALSTGSGATNVYSSRT